MVIAALVLAAAAAAAGDDGIVAKGSIAIGSGVISAIGGWFAAKRHAEKTAIPQPCEVRQVNDCVSVKECNRRMKSLEERMDKIEERVSGGFDNILKKLDAMDKRSEDRAIALNRRIDPMMEKLAATNGQVEMIKEHVRDAWSRATIGGKKA